MNILILGGSGFIGGKTAEILRARGHKVSTPSSRDINLLALNEAQAKRFLAGQDAVINTVGVMSRHAHILEAVHHTAPVQLAKWAAQSGVRRWVQLSALGADAHHDVAFVGSKGRGDAALLNLKLPHFSVNIARPSVVFGRGGGSCEAFIKMARLPLIALPAAASGLMQPVHLNDVAQGLVLLAEGQADDGAIIDMTGTTRHTLADYLRILRETIHGKRGLKTLFIPMALITPFLPLGNIVSNGFLSRNSMKLLRQGACADTADFAALLQHEPLGAAQFAEYY